MTGLAGRGLGSIRLVRTGIEIAALACGWLLGGSVGLGTLAFAMTIGPNVQFFLPRLAMAAHPDDDGGEPEPETAPSPSGGAGPRAALDG
jgi:uncharacterized membrane protein YczE